MFGNSKGTHEYSRIGLETGVSTSSPHGLIVMLYEGAISSCNLAVGAIQQNDIEKRGQAVTKAIMIIETGLRASLDKKSGGEVAQSLDRLYEYMTSRLYSAHLKNDATPILEVLKLLHDIKQAWQAIANIEAKQAAANNMGARVVAHTI